MSIAAIFFVVVWLSSYLYRIIQALIYASIGSIIFNRITKSKLEYQTILRLAVIAVTPAIVLATIFDFFGITFSYHLLFYFVISMIYLYFGISVNKPNALEVVPPPNVEPKV